MTFWIKFGPFWGDLGAITPVIKVRLGLNAGNRWFSWISNINVTNFEILKCLWSQEMLRIFIFDPTLCPPEWVQNWQKSVFLKKRFIHEAIQISKCQGSISSHFSMENAITFGVFFFFFILKDQKVTDQVSTTFSEALQSGVTCGEKNGGCRLIPIRSIPALMSFFCFRIPYFDFRCVVWYHTQTNKK